MLKVVFLCKCFTGICKCVGTGSQAAQRGFLAHTHQLRDLSSCKAKHHSSALTLAHIPYYPVFLVISFNEFKNLFRAKYHEDIYLSI